MTDLSALCGFAVVVGLLTLTPGLDTALILRTAALGHRRRAWGVVLGIQSGTLAWGLLTSLGITALLTASHLAYAIVRWAGAAYLVWMGARMIWSARRRPAAPEEADVDDETGRLRTGSAPDTLRGGWRQGAVTNLLNPKMGAFYVAVLPQFIPPGASQLAMGVLLASVHVVLAVLWSCALIAFARVLRNHLRRAAARRLLDRITGTVIGAFGIRLALGD
ncbi:putative LysE family transporter [Streptomyces sp. NBRC 110611]|uniref:LysE family translocator n=1 Tax=Streptomyces sp. NBRC 110611 TaxID=1621259 RepID=UPI000834207C|nr:LysE family translocator [Streptomyces sp. NBRC 110611]GAU65024.1 putative LysE family transporter [Streptomyces sp. NBRC 110611]